MTNMTLSIPEELHKRMKKLSEIRWSEIARRAIEQRVDDLEVMNRIASKSKLTKKDAEEISKKINKGIAKRFNEYSSN
jgi:predicted CopG family antitoxin